MKNQFLTIVLALVSISLYAGNTPIFIGIPTLHTTALTNGRTVFSTVISSNTTIYQSDLDGYTWPVSIMGGVVVTLGEDISLNQSFQYFTVDGDGVVFEGDNKTVTIDNINGYPGLLQNGSGISNGYNDVIVNHIRVHSLNSVMADDGGWIGQTYFAINATNVVISNCTSDGDILNFAGGITGSNSHCTILNSHSSGLISYASGGIFGAYSGGIAINSYSTGNSDNYCGGIYGYNSTGVASDCYSTGNIGYESGGILGYFSSGTAIACYSTGDIVSSYGGGIAGSYFSGSIDNCYSTGNIGSYSGGITGAENSGSITNCYSTGTIDPGGGGIAGENDYGTISNCLSGNGSWNDADAISSLSGEDGSIWTDIGITPTDIPYKLTSFSAELYSPATENIPENALINSPAGNFITGTYSIISINNDDPSLHASVTINASNGIMSFTNSGNGSFTSKILYTDNSDESYQVSDYTLNILSTLPVTWLSFNVTPGDNAAWLQWSISAEQNTRDFIVQHSINGSNWTSIATMTAAGNSTAITNYNYLHADPVTGNNYYRIKQTDLDGRFSYSSIQKLKVTQSSKSFSVLNTVVSNGILQVSIKAPVVLSLYANDGRLVWKKEFNAGVQNIDCIGVSKGMYFLKGKDAVEKIFVQ